MQQHTIHSDCLGNTLTLDLPRQGVPGESAQAEAIGLHSPDISDRGCSNSTCDVRKLQAAGRLLVCFVTHLCESIWDSDLRQACYHDGATLGQRLPQKSSQLAIQEGHVRRVRSDYEQKSVSKRRPLQHVVFMEDCCTWIESRHCHCSSQPSLSKPFLKQAMNEELARMLSLEKTSNSITYLLGHKQIKSSALTECMQRQVDGRTFRAVSCAAL